MSREKSCQIPTILKNADGGFERYAVEGAMACVKL